MRPFHRKLFPIVQGIAVDKSVLLELLMLPPLPQLEDEEGQDPNHDTEGEDNQP